MSTSTRGSYTLLGLLIALVVGLSVEALRTVEEHRHNTDRVLTEYAGLAAWSFRTVWRADWEAQGKAALGPVVGQALQRPADTLPTVAIFAHVAQEFARCADPAEDSLRFYFRYDHRTGELLTAGRRPPDALLRMLRDSLAPREGRIPRELFGFTSVPTPGERRVVLAGEKAGPDGGVVAAFGLETCMRSIGRDAFPRVFALYPLLPPDRVGAIPNDSLLSIAVTRGREGEAGETLFASRPQYPAAYSGWLVERPGEVGLRFEARLRPDLAPRLVAGAGNRPGGRVLWLGLLLLATLGLAGVVLAQIRREEQLVRARGDFVSSVSHELRTPLAQIRLFAESLKLGSTRSERDRSAAVDVILQESQRLMNLVENVLHFARTERGGRTPFPERVDLSLLAREVVEAFEPLTRGRGIRYRTELSERVTVQLEPGPTRQILLNLLDNAAKFSPPDHTVTVRTWLEDGWASVAVEDEGPGVPEAERDTIWQPFVRLRANASRAPGSGIGLAVVRDLVARQDGSVRVDRGARGGAVFTVRFPASRVPVRNGRG
jgi:signal transduction histidine kinase